MFFLVLSCVFVVPHSLIAFELFLDDSLCKASSRVWANQRDFQFFRLIFDGGNVHVDGESGYTAHLVHSKCVRSGWTHYKEIRQRNRNCFELIYEKRMVLYPPHLFLETGANPRNCVYRRCSNLQSPSSICQCVFSVMFHLMSATVH